MQSEECLAKTMETMQLLARDPQAPCYYLLTGASMREVAYQGLHLKPVLFRPQHRNKLGNEFLLYTNSAHAAARFGGWDSALDPSAVGQTL